MLRIIDILLARPVNNKSDERESSTLTCVLVAHDCDINDLPYFTEEVLQICLSSRIQDTTNEKLLVNWKLT